MPTIRIEAALGQFGPPIKPAELQKILEGALLLGAHSAALLAPDGGTLLEVASDGLGPAAAGTASLQDPEVSVPVVAAGTSVAAVRLSCRHSTGAGLDDIARLTASRVASVWSAAQEIDDLAGEIVHAYEELHLLYELGESLTGQISTATAANLLLDKLMETLRASWGTLEVTITAEPIRIERGVKIRSLSSGANGGESCVMASLRSNGETVGYAEVARADEDEPFTSRDIKLLDAAATLAGNAIRSVQLYEELRQQAEVLGEREARLRAIMDNVAEGIVTLSEDGNVLSFNRAAEQILGYDQLEVVGRPFSMLLSRSGVADWEDLLAVRLSPPEKDAPRDSHTEFIGRRKDGTTFSMEITLGDMAAGSRRTFIMSMRDITERKRLQAELAHRYEEARFLADRDSVTGLLNHRAIHERLRRDLKRSERSGQRLSIVMMDLDGFKLFNDTYGHPVGDQILRNVTALLRQYIRESDVLGRYGGDEFVALLPDTGVDGALELAERLRSAVANHPYVAVDGSRVPVHLSFGISTYPDNGQQINELVGFADANMLESKQQGGNTVTVWKGQKQDDSGAGGVFGILDGLVTAVDRKDHYTRRHSDDVTTYAVAFARALGLSEESQRMVRIAGLLHDVGKIGVPDRVLRKPGRLTDEETTAIRQHALLGEMILKEIPNLPEVVAAVGSHHERYDGEGYPRGLKQGEIPLLARILAVADAYSAMTTDRPYRKALSPEDSKAELLSVAGSQLDPELVPAFIDLLATIDSMDMAS